MTTNQTDDLFTPYERGVRTLLERLGNQHEEYANAEVLKQRLMENISATRLYGDTETRRAERAEIINQVSLLARFALGLSFDEMCHPMPETTPVSPPEPYTYDIFLSYANGFEGLFGEWTRNHFYKLFKLHLEDALGRRPEVYMDEQQPVTTTPWPMERKRALADSCCVVALFSPSYFDSPWCMQELLSMHQREKLPDFQNATEPISLVHPVIISDGDGFPQVAKELRHQPFDCRNFMRVGDAFEKTLRYIDFQDRMSQWVVGVARTVRQAPPQEAGVVVT